MNEDFLLHKITGRKEQNAFRQLRTTLAAVDFCSNDYLGIVKNDLLQAESREHSSGSTGSRLLTGNNVLIEQTEQLLAAFHQATAALIFNSGYDANTGLLACVPQRGDTVLYDYLSHASIRDGLRLSMAASFSFLHNDLADLEKKLRAAKGNIFVVTESVFSMDGDTAPLTQIIDLCRQYHAYAIVDEAHATGVVGPNGAGLIQQEGLQQECFARIHTFGKALGCHGAVVLGSNTLRDYLVNFCRSFIYTTALPPLGIASIKKSYEVFPYLHDARTQLQQLVSVFQSAHIRYERLHSDTPVQSVVIPGNDAVKAIANQCQQHGFDVRAILYPTVSRQRERLRIVLHAFNTTAELERLLKVLEVV